MDPLLPRDDPVDGSLESHRWGLPGEELEPGRSDRQDCTPITCLVSGKGADPDLELVMTGHTSCPGIDTGWAHPAAEDREPVGVIFPAVLESLPDQRDRVFGWNRLGSQSEKEEEERGEGVIHHEECGATD